MHGDESVHAWLAWNLYNGTGYQYDPVYHGPLQFIVTSGLFFLFGVSNTSARLMAVLFGTALVGLPYFLRYRMGRPAALIASAFLAFSPAFVYVSRLERDDIFAAFFALTMTIGLWRYVDTRRSRYVYLIAASAALSLTAMENTYITLFVLGTFVLAVLASESLAPRLAPLWGETESNGSVKLLVLAAAAVTLLLAFALTIVTGLFFPVPAVLAAELLLLVNRESVLETVSRGASFGPALRSITVQQWLNAVTIVLAILVLAFSVFGSDMRGLWDSTQPLLNSGSACPGNTFVLNPCRKDILGGLFYWLSQHKVARGGQPWFYYPLLFGLYEQIAVILGVAGIVWFARRPTLFTSFVTWWAIVSLGVYSWAGEKFPWLMIHPLLPFLLLAAMFTADVIRLRNVLTYIVLAGLALLGLLELHSTYEVNFVNGANPVEMMVYVQSSPDTPKVASRVLTLSYKLTSGLGMPVTIDSLDTWPFAWYLRDMPHAAYPGYPDIVNKPYRTNPVIIVDQDHQASLYPKIRKSYHGHIYRLRWWFPEDYKSLTWGSFAHDAIDPGYWRVVWQWLTSRRPFGPTGAVWFYVYVKNNLVSPY